MKLVTHADATVLPPTRWFASVVACLHPITREIAVPYALFENDEQLTRPFRTEREVWEAAERADLITTGANGEKVLDNNFEIKPCDATAEELRKPPQEIIFPERQNKEPERNGLTKTPLPPRQFKTRETSS
jgi:hypothetical protein